MGKKDVDLLDGFSFLHGNVSQTDDISDPIIDDTEEIIDDTDADIVDDVDIVDDTEEVVDDVDIVNDDTVDDDDVDGIDLKPHFEFIHKELFGDDFDDKEMPEDYNSPEGFASWIKGIIDENSGAQYSSEISKEFDEYIKDGGRPEKFLETVANTELDYDNLDLEDVPTQRKLVEKYLKTKGFSDNSIQSKLKRYEDSGILEEESEEAYEFLKINKSKEKERIVEEQKARKIQEEESRKAFVSNAQEFLNKKDDFNGLVLDKKQKGELLSYIFDSDRSGKTQYQKDYEKDPVSFLIDNALFYKYKDRLMADVKKQAASKAADVFKKKLKSGTKDMLSRNNKGASSDLDALERFTKFRS